MKLCFTTNCVLQNVCLFYHLIHNGENEFDKRGDDHELDFTMMTSSNWSIFRVTGHLCGDFTGHR